MLFNVYALYWLLTSLLFYHCFGEGNDRNKKSFIYASMVWCRNDIFLCWTDPTNCQLKWLRTRSAKIPHEEKYFVCWSYHVERWFVNETTCKTVPKPPKFVFFKNNCGNWVFSFEFWGQFGSIFRKLISDIFIGFHTPYHLAVKNASHWKHKCWKAALWNSTGRSSCKHAEH